MKTVAPHLVTPVVLIWYCVQICYFGEGLVKCCVENGDLRYVVAEYLACCRDATQVVRVVQRREINELLEAALYGRIDERGLGEHLATVHDSVTHCIDLADR